MPDTNKLPNTRKRSEFSELYTTFTRGFSAQVCYERRPYFSYLLSLLIHSQTVEAYARTVTATHSYRRYPKRALQ